MIRTAISASAAALLILSGCQTAEHPASADLASQPVQATPDIPPTSLEEIGELRAGSGYLKGYLDPATLPDSAALLPPPPEAGSARSAADMEVYTTTRAYRDTGRWTLAQSDNELMFPAAARAFSCALGADISHEATPHLETLMRRTLADAGRSTYKAKELYQRTRPFALQQEESCVPEAEAMLATDGSYPSGHSALGWAWGLVLAEIAPDRADALVQRGYDFGQSRVVCGVHWQSDVDAGRVMGAATVARLHADPVFRAQMELAKAEVEAARAAGNAPANCP